MHREATLFRTVHFQVCDDKKMDQWELSYDLPVGPEVPACSCFTPGPWFSVGDGRSSETWTVGKWPFLSLKLLLKSEGLDQKKSITFVVKMTDTVRVTANSRMASPERRVRQAVWRSQESCNFHQQLVGKLLLQKCTQQTLLLLILFVVFGLGHGFSRDIVCTSFIKINNICKNHTKAPFILVYLVL